MGFKNILFDWSGVISNNVDDHVDHVSYLFENHGVKRITKRELRAKWTQPFMKFYNQYIPDWTLDEHKREYAEASHLFQTRRIYPGMHKLVLELIKEKKNLYVVSSDLKTPFYNELKRYKLENCFKKIMLESHDKIEDLLYLIKTEKLNKNETVFIGDTTHETECAKKAGIKSIAVTWGMTSPSRLKNADPDFVAKNVKELRSILK